MIQGAVVARASYVGALFAIAVLVTCGPVIREDELECEEAFAHLKECCPGFVRSAAYYCDYRPGPCGTYYPALPADESRCIRSKDCKQLGDQGVCERAQTANPIEESDSGTRVAVCR